MKEKLSKWFNSRTKLELIGIVMIAYMFISALFQRTINYKRNIKSLEASNKEVKLKVMELDSNISNIQNYFKDSLNNNNKKLLIKFIVIENKIDKKEITIDDLKSMDIF